MTAGDVQWMKTGSGIIHSEMPEQEHGRLAGFQLWVNLPAKEKLCDPAYHEYPKDQIPVEHRTSRVDINVITGTTCEGTAGPVKGVVTSPLYFDIRLSSEASIEELRDSVNTLRESVERMANLALRLQDCWRLYVRACFEQTMAWTVRAGSAIYSDISGDAKQLSAEIDEFEFA